MLKAVILFTFLQRQTSYHPTLVSQLILHSTLYANKRMESLEDIDSVGIKPILKWG